MKAVVTVRRLMPEEVADADRIFRTAFGTWLKLPDPQQLASDASWIATRFAGRLGGAHAALAAGRLVGSNFTARRGSVAYFGPLTVDPVWWGRGVGRALAAAAIDDFTRWDVRHGGLCTFADSVLHSALYRKFGFWPGHLIGLFAKELSAGVAARDAISYGSSNNRELLEADADAICGSICDGLTVLPELRSVAAQSLGDVLFVEDGGRADGFAVCHCGPGTEGGSGLCRVKFAAARSASAFGRLVGAWEALAWSRNAPRVEAGVSFGRELAARALADRGYDVIRQSVAMYRPNDPAYDHRDAWVVDDWR